MGFLWLSMGEKCLIRCIKENLSEVDGEDIDERLNERQWQLDKLFEKGKAMTARTSKIPLTGRESGISEALSCLLELWQNCTFDGTGFYTLNFNQI